MSNDNYLNILNIIFTNKRYTVFKFMIMIHPVILVAILFNY